MFNRILRASSEKRFQTILFQDSPLANNPDILSGFSQAVTMWLASTADLSPIDIEEDLLIFLECFPFSSLEEFFLCAKQNYLSVQHSEERKPEYSDFLFPVWSLVGDASVESFRTVHHYCRFMLKFPAMNDSLSQSCIRDFIQNDNITVTASDSVLSALREVVTESLPEKPLEYPDHGPGSTSDAGNSLQDKEYSLGSCELLTGLMPEVIPWMTERELSRGFAPFSKLVLVPKTATSLRSICEEPATNQYWQQGLAKSLSRSIREGWLGQFVHIEDQGYSRRLAILASKGGNLSTIDLSAASDSVSLELVEKIFPWHWLRKLIAVRTPATIIDEECTVLPLKKYSSMGSAVTFPLECIIFACCCRLVAERCQVLLTTDNFAVYGDDIIIPNELVPPLIELLGSLGFKVNLEKSFTRNSYRESCGVFAYAGVDITTPAISRNFYRLDAPFGVAQLSRLTQMANAFLMDGCFTARKFVLSYLKPFLKGIKYWSIDLSMPFDTWPTSCIWTFGQSKNEHLLRRHIATWPEKPLPTTPVPLLGLPGPVLRRTTTPDYQAPDYRVWTTTLERYRQRYDDYTKLQWWLRRASARRDSGVNPLIAPVGVSPRKRLRLR